MKSQARPSNFYPRPAKGGLQPASTFFDASVSVCQRSMQSGVRWPWLPGLGGQLVMLPGLCSVPSKPQHLYKLHVEINGNPNTNNVSLNLSTWSVSANEWKTGIYQLSAALNGNPKNFQTNPSPVKLEMCALMPEIDLSTLHCLNPTKNGKFVTFHWI